MIDIPAIFKSRTLDADKLREYGFSYSEDQYTMDFPIMENQYTAKITISSDGSADFRVYETDSDEEYMPAHIYNATGAFVGGIHKACEKILKNISEKCYYTEYFKAEDKYTRHSYHKEIYNNPMSLNDFWENHSTAWDFPIHAITYRTQVLRDNEIKVGDRYYGDIEYNLYPLPHVQTICILPFNITVYFRGSDEQSTSTAGYAKHYKDYAAMSQRITMFLLNIPTTLNHNLYKFIDETVRGTIARTYHLMMSPLYAGKADGVKEELRKYDSWLKETNKELYNYCGKQKKHGIAFIRIWRWFDINLLKL